MKRTIIEFQPSDRNIVLFTHNDMLIGLNYWQGVGDMSIADGFMQPSKKLNLGLLDGITLGYAINNIEIIDNLIWDNVII